MCTHMGFHSWDLFKLRVQGPRLAHVHMPIKNTSGAHVEMFSGLCLDLEGIELELLQNKSVTSEVL